MNNFSSLPEENPQDVGYEQDQADPGGEALGVAAPLDLLVLRDVGQGAAEHHDDGRQQGQQRPGTLCVLRLDEHLGLHRSGRRSARPQVLREERRFNIHTEEIPGVISNWCGMNKLD